MTTEQLKELSEALSVLCTKSSVLKERDELRALMEENLQAEEVMGFVLVAGPLD
jgi:LETM1 and EF-hand domain-containing protein 1